MCKDNFSGDGSFFFGGEGEGCGSVVGLLFFRVSSIVEFFSIISSLGDCFSIEYNLGGGDGDVDSRGDVVDEVDDNVDEVLVLLFVRRMCRNSYFVM